MDATTGTYENISGNVLSNLVIHDLTPAFTRFTNATSGPLPQNLTDGTIASPSPGDTGAITWTFEGVLAHGSTGTVTFQVTVH